MSNATVAALIAVVLIVGGGLLDAHDGFTDARIDAAPSLSPVIASGVAE